MPQNSSSISETDPILPSRQGQLESEDSSRHKGLKDYGSRDHDSSGDSPPPSSPSAPSCLQRSLGLLLAFLSGVLLTAFSAVLKLVTVGPMQVVIIRGGLQFFIMGSVAIYKKKSFTGERLNSRCQMII